MAFDKPTRNRLAKFVADARGVIADEFTEQFQSLYGISSKGDIAPLDKLGHLDEAGMVTAALLRERIGYLERTHPHDKDGTKAAVTRLAREQAFTILNRLAAIRMAEMRGLIVESVGKGYQSKGFKVFETVAGSALGDTYHRYRRYLFCLFDELAIDLGALFDRRSPQALLFPREPALLALLDLFHASDLEPLWAEDETIGWIYQYYNDPEERKKMRKESAAPRNSRELAVRNQFFTPRYVVEFLTDNTLGRIWYEMTKGQTRLVEQCRYLVRRPTEIFLAEGETVPETPDQEGLSQEELLKQPVHIPHRPLKDPREIRLLDPACGSMHFGLYAFDLFETIYDEAWDSGSCPGLHQAYASKDEFLKDVPRLIIEHNIHGIDIDPRATQIAALSLWLRAQKAWQQQKVPAADRPRVRRSNIVCAEPMPGSPEMLKEFVATLNPPLLGELVKTVFVKMQLAGEAGSLLKIEEEIRTAIDSARKEWLKQQDDLLTRKDGSQEEFFDTAEQQVIDALRAYAEQADTDSYQRRLFADDAARGFAFIDLCRKRYDAVVMNPPFGDPSKDSNKYLNAVYFAAKHDLASAFLESAASHLCREGMLGCICTRTLFFLSYLSNWRIEFFSKALSTHLFADMGVGVLDALVDTCVLVASRRETSPRKQFSTFFRLQHSSDRVEDFESCIRCSNLGTEYPLIHTANIEDFHKVPRSPFTYWVSRRVLNTFASLPPFENKDRHGHIGALTQDDFRFVRNWWEPKPLIMTNHVEPSTGEWARYNKGGTFSPFYMDISLVLLWKENGRELKEFITNYRREKGFADQWTSQLNAHDFYFTGGVSWSSRPHMEGSFWALPRGVIFGNTGPAVLDSSTDALLWNLAVLNSRAYRSLLDLLMPRGSSGTQTLKYELGYVRSVPIPRADDAVTSDTQGLAREILIHLQRLDSGWEDSTVFSSITLVPMEEGLQREFIKHRHNVDNASGAIAQGISKIDHLMEDLYGLVGGGNRDPLLDLTSVRASTECFKLHKSLSREGLDEFLQRVVSYLLGTALGRWDIRYATGERQPPELPAPFDPLPVCPPGMLQNAEGLPAESKDVPADYPLRISWPGILVDDENHPEDIVTRVREAIEVIWKDRAEAIEQEACGILGVKTLRDYFRRPAAFFADHLKRYSKSRRQAPIYWPLSTKSGSYTLWLYYHRLSDQTLHTCLADFLVPKLRKVQSELDTLTGSGGGGTRAGELREFLDELHDLRDEIERVIKLPWKPNLNDGVPITASPLHKLFRLPKWQKDLKACWDKLAKGEYDWAHLAYSIWPGRVEKACEKDRSIAIAHGLEHLCKIEPPKPKKQRAKESTEGEELDEDESELIEED